MSAHYHNSDCEPAALERIADALEAIADVVGEWAEANRTPRLIVRYPEDLDAEEHDPGAPWNIAGADR